MTLALRPSNPFNTSVVALPISRRSFGFVRSSARASISSKRTSTRSGQEKPSISLKSEATFFAVCPNLLSTRAVVLTLNNSRLSIRARCLTASVLPVPGEPSNKNLLMPIRWLTALTMPKISRLTESGNISMSVSTTTLSRKGDSDSIDCGIIESAVERSDMI